MAFCILFKHFAHYLILVCFSGQDSFTLCGEYSLIPLSYQQVSGTIASPAHPVAYLHGHPGFPV
jgi:hypothetical protein